MRKLKFSRRVHEKVLAGVGEKVLAGIGETILAGVGETVLQELVRKLSQ